VRLRKSTLLQMVAGLDAPSSGANVVDGKRPSRGIRCAYRHRSGRGCGGAGRGAHRLAYNQSLSEQFQAFGAQGDDGTVADADRLLGGCAVTNATSTAPQLGDVTIAGRSETVGRDFGRRPCDVAPVARHPSRRRLAGKCAYAYGAGRPGARVADR
jgi:hypothetical protein